ncbi:hypothetical protein [Plantibacter sp. YIM 135249]|jgi:hypothetical protein|uniref:hypothetical protein n=1 Tax=Plantibacter sp. YIM 135249 TaxID=3423918 RepID=UPI003D34BB5A
MTLTSIIPSLRRSIPDPIAPDLWPEHTTATTTDIVVSGVAMARLVDWCGTPCVHTAAAVIRGTGGRPSSTEQATVIVVTVTGTAVTASGMHVATIDAELDEVEPVWSEMRLIGRVSTAHAHIAAVVGADAHADADADGTDFDSDDSDIDSGTSDSERSNAAMSDECRPIHLAPLPDDVHVGDLLAVPCCGAVALRQLRSGAHAPTLPHTPTTDLPRA